MKKINQTTHPHPAHPGDESQCIKIITWYTPGEGYKATVLPEKVSQREGYSIRESGAFTGFNIRILENVARRTSKTDKEAERLISENLERFLNYFAPKTTEV